ncbi:glycoside hydrolase family 66 protein [Pseudonocardia sp.]|jgi:dextranase|uniref:glycoside hydrolase family 66 protein n=1 Tax=Pseudonocardia sp. TaxID=60912 RepID=UPI0031FE1582
MTYEAVVPPSTEEKTTPELLPSRARFAPDQPVAVEVRTDTAPDVATVWHLGECIREVPVTTPGDVVLGALPPGGYGVEVVTGSRVLRTAVEVSSEPATSLRYGFVASYSPRRETDAVADNIRRLHLTGVQFYDWAYRHADLLGGGEDYRDALGQPIALGTVRNLVAVCHAAGAAAYGYAAVYAVGPDEWPGWEHLALLRPEGAPYGLGDFLFLLDPAAPSWLAHFIDDLQRAVDEVGFDGFHLDQYGYPKRAVRPDGATVDVAESFAAMIEQVREALPDARLVFNNVNDFPTWRTAHAPQDALYIEVWAPHLTLDHLAGVVRRARAEAEGKPVVIAAYQHVYDSAPAGPSDLATAYTMATLFSHGATHLLAGEADRILVDPYYVRNHRAAASTMALLKRWYDFLVEHVELLMPAELVDVTGSYASEYNDDCDVTYAVTPVTDTATPGGVWRRVVQAGDSLVVHLVNLTGQHDTLWDAPRETPAGTGTGSLRVRRTGPHLPQVRVADPDRSARLVDVPVRADGDHAVAELPAPHIWQLVLINPSPSAKATT